MNITSTNIYWTGCGIWLIYNLMIYSKIHRKKNVVTILFLIGIISLFFGIGILSNPEFKMGKGHGATSLFMPIIYISTYQILRMIFKKQKGMEPAYQYASSYDSEDKRKLSFFDYIVYILPIALSVVISILIGQK